MYFRQNVCMCGTALPPHSLPPSFWPVTLQLSSSPGSQRHTGRLVRCSAGDQSEEGGGTGLVACCRFSDISLVLTILLTCVEYVGDGLSLKGLHRRFAQVL